MFWHGPANRFALPWPEWCCACVSPGPSIVLPDCFCSIGLMTSLLVNERGFDYAAPTSVRPSPASRRKQTSEFAVNSIGQRFGGRSTPRRMQNPSHLLPSSRVKVQKTCLCLRLFAHLTRAIGEQEQEQKQDQDLAPSVLRPVR